MVQQIIFKQNFSLFSPMATLNATCLVYLFKFTVASNLHSVSRSQVFLTEIILQAQELFNAVFPSDRTRNVSIAALSWLMGPPPLWRTSALNTCKQVLSGNWWSYVWWQFWDDKKSRRMWRPWVIIINARKCFVHFEEAWCAYGQEVALWWRRE